MAAPPKPKFAQALKDRIVNTRGVLASERMPIRRSMSFIAESAGPLASTDRDILLALQVAARDDQVWTALVAARAALGKT